MKNISHYDDYDDDSVNVTVTEHSGRCSINANDSLSKLKAIKVVRKILTDLLVST